MMYPNAVQGPYYVGQDEPLTITRSDINWIRAWGVVGTIVGGAGVYHGYKRSGGRILPALGYGALGWLLPIVGAPVMLAQGFGDRK